MEVFRISTSFGTVFPIASRGALCLAILMWGISIGRSVIQRQSVTAEPEAKGLSWQDITPTCDVVISDIAKEHATVTSCLNKCRDIGSSLVDLDAALHNAKKTLRMTNIGSIEDPDLRDALLTLRRQQIQNYTTIRKNLRPFLDAEAKTERTLTDAEGRLRRDFLRQSEESLGSFSKLMVEFTIEASILPDEIDSDRARDAIFSSVE